MKGKTRKVAVGAFVAMAFLVLAAGLSHAHGARRGGGEGFPGTYPERLLDRLGATAEQKAQIRETLGKYRPEAEPAVRQLAAERQALRRMIRDGAADENAIRAQSAKVSSLEADLAVVRARAAKEVRSFLTAEQIAKLGELEAERERKAGRHMERRFRGREGETR
jgi:Spy/CpxP family protein refolding chaperone